MTAWWTLGNLVSPIRQSQFVEITKAFSAAAIEKFGVECGLEILPYDRDAEFHGAGWHAGDEETCHWLRRRATLGTLFTIDQMTPDIWAKAKQIGVSIQPLDEKEDSTAWAKATFFPSLNSRLVNFYISGSTMQDDFIDPFCRKFPFMLRYSR